MTLNYFFIVFVLVILTTRVLLWLLPKHAPKIAGFQMHHYMYGLILVAVYFLVSTPILLPIGLALLADELPLFFIFKGWNWPDNHWKQYHSWQSIGSVAVISLLSYLAGRVL